MEFCPEKKGVGSRYSKRGSGLGSMHGCVFSKSNESGLLGFQAFTPRKRNKNFEPSDLMQLDELT